ncbi:hypothetical protein CC80DRAFT_530652 [Byssothecium circinans]|uniref:Uncharacterized protein n=1 Tax=Byssothecium circinans TaxID=147558 RepID=A0A6A5UNQ6_9PLEO|nr:hypothetical protein CC80DRAFT_530652 [Byssothecium circinans]
MLLRAFYATRKIIAYAFILAIFLHEPTFRCLVNILIGLHIVLRVAFDLFVRLITYSFPTIEASTLALLERICQYIAPVMRVALTHTTDWGAVWVRESPRYLCEANSVLVGLGESMTRGIVEVDGVIYGSGRDDLETWKAAGEEVARFCGGAVGAVDVARRKKWNLLRYLQPSILTKNVAHLVKPRPYTDNRALQSPNLIFHLTVTTPWEPTRTQYRGPYVSPEALKQSVEGPVEDMGTIVPSARFLENLLDGGTSLGVKGIAELWLPLREEKGKGVVTFKIGYEEDDYIHFGIRQTYWPFEKAMYAVIVEGVKMQRDLMSGRVEEVVENVVPEASFVNLASANVKVRDVVRLWNEEVPGSAEEENDGTRVNGMLKMGGSQVLAGAMKASDGVSVWVETKDGDPWVFKKRVRVFDQ